MLGKLSLGIMNHHPVVVNFFSNFSLLFDFVVQLLRTRRRLVIFGSHQQIHVCCTVFRRQHILCAGLARDQFANLAAAGSAHNQDDHQEALELAFKGQKLSCQLWKDGRRDWCEEYVEVLFPRVLEAQ